MVRANVVSAFAAFGFAASGAMTLSAALVIRNIKLQPEIRVSRDHFAWPMELKLAFDSPVTVVEAPALVIPKTHTQVRTTARRKITRAKLVAKIPVSVEAVKDSVTKSMSAAQEAVAPPTEVLAEVAPTLDDAALVMTTWKTLRGRMDQVVATLDSTVARIAVAMPEATLPAIVAIQPVALVSKKPTVATQQKKSVVRVVSALNQTESRNILKLSDGSRSLDTQGVANISGGQTRLAKTETYGDYKDNSAYAAGNPMVDTQPVGTEVVSAVNTIRATETAPVKQAEVNTQSNSATISTSGFPFTLKSGYPTVRLSSAPAATVAKSSIKKTGGRVANLPDVGSPEYSRVAKTKKGKEGDDAGYRDSEAGSRDSGVDSGMSAASLQDSIPALGGYYVAFDSTKKISAESVTVTRLSYEGLAPTDDREAASAPGYIKLTAPESLPTLVKRMSRYEDMPVFLQSHLTEAAIVGKTYVEGMGIIFGKLDPAYRLEAGDKELVFEKNGQTFFLLLNAVPGPFPVVIRNKVNGVKVTLEVLVQVGTASYVDLSVIKFADIQGRVVEDSVAAGRTEVQVFGTSKLDVTAQDGTFALREVPYIPGYPIELDTVRPGLDVDSPEKNVFLLEPSAKPVTLFHVKPETEKSWTGQLEGSIDKDSSKLLALFRNPKGADGKLQHPLKAAFSETTSEVVSDPEIYILSDTEQMLPDQPLNPESPRAIGVNIQDGYWVLNLVDPTRVEIRNGVGQPPVVWSKLLRFRERARTVAIE